MNAKIKLALCTFSILVLCLGWSATGLAKPEPGACVEKGALVWNDWTSTDAGGSGMPAGENFRDYVRCKSCHGWDRRGLKGGYVRRTRTAERPNAGLGDSNRTSRDIAPGMGDYYHIRADEVLHAGTGRAYEDGSGSWVPLDDNPDQANIDAHAAGFTLGNLHPDFSTTGVNAGDIVLTQEQVDCVALFVNFGDSDPNFYFIYIDTKQNPAVYVINEGARANAGQEFYEQTCQACHGDPLMDYNGDNDGKPEGGMLNFLRGDGRYSEFVHKARWGIPDTVMTRAAMGSPDSQNMIDVMLYLQELNAANTSTHTIGGVVSGLVGRGLVVQNNEGDGLLISANGSFTFDTPLFDGSSYAVTIKTQPSEPNQTCVVSNGSGTLNGADVTDVLITCVTNPPTTTYTVGGNVGGLLGTGLVLQNNSGADLAIDANGIFTFDTPIDDGSAYEVTVSAQPSAPDQYCSVSNGSGTVNGAAVSDVQISCAGFRMNTGLNDAWYDPITNGQGFFITVFPDIGYVSLSWFTYDTERPPEDVTAHLGEPGQRWLNALGAYSGNQAVLDITIASGGIFDTPTEITELIDGTIILTFEDCENGFVEYDIPSIDRSGIVPIQRVASDNIALCEELEEQNSTQLDSTRQADDKQILSTDIPVVTADPPLLVDLNTGLNDAWYNPETNGQGFFITVFPEIGLVSLSWFTYETDRPDESVTANLGDPGHRWFTGLGPYDGHMAAMDIYITSGGILDTPTEVLEVMDGTIILTFFDCESGTVEYDIPSIDQQGVVPIQRVVDDNISLCEAMISGGG